VLAARALRSESNCESLVAAQHASEMRACWAKALLGMTARQEEPPGRWRYESASRTAHRQMNVPEGDAVAQDKHRRVGDKECSWKKEAICQNAR
jgi:hypothetical protein